MRLNSEYFKHIIDEGNNELDELLQDSKIDPRAIIPPPPVCWEIINGDGSRSTIGTIGNFSLIIGKAKSRKSFFISLALSAASKNGLILNRFKGILPTHKDEVLYFDTEQGSYHVLKAAKRICSLMENATPPNLQVHSLRKYDTAKRLVLIEYAIYKNDRIGFVVIDGIRDLVKSINDESEASMIACKLLKWSEERQIHIVTVLHQNKGDNNARGHLGTELVNKAETVLSVSKSTENKEISIVEAEYCRGIDPEPFGFEIDENELPRFSENWQVRTSKKSIDIDELSTDQLNQLVNLTFFNDDPLTYSELVIAMKGSFKRIFQKKIGTNKAKEIITQCNISKLIQQNGHRGKYSKVTDQQQ